MCVLGVRGRGWEKGCRSKQGSSPLLPRCRRYNSVHRSELKKWLAADDASASKRKQQEEEEEEVAGPSSAAAAASKKAKKGARAGLGGV